MNEIQFCTGCGTTSREDVSGSYSVCCNERVAYGTQAQADKIVADEVAYLASLDN